MQSTVDQGFDVTQSQSPVVEVQIDGIALLKIVKHCHESLPTMVTGSLLGLDVNGLLEVSYSYPFPTSKGGESEDGKEPLDGQEYQIEMMKLLRDVNIDNNCVGWYQSMHLGTVSTSEVVAHQYNYQISEELSDNSILLAYDAAQSTNGTLVLKAFRLSAEYIEAKQNNTNEFIKPSNILEELPIRIKNGSLISAYLRDLHDSSLVGLSTISPSSSASALNDYQFSALSMNNSEDYLEKQMDLVRLWIDDLIDLQAPFQTHSKNSQKLRSEHVRFLTKRMAENAIRHENGEELLPMTTSSTVTSNGVSLNDGLKPLPDAPLRSDVLLTLRQLSNYCNQINTHVQNDFQNLYLSSQICTSETEN